MSDSFSRDLVNQLREMGAVDPRDAEIERLTDLNANLGKLKVEAEDDELAAAHRAEKAEAERDEATDTIEWLNSNNLTLCAELAGWKQSARQMEAERDEARAQVAALMQDRADLAQIIDNAITPNDAETHRLLLDGTYHTGPVVDWVHRVMTTMRDLLRKPPADAQAALEAYGREKVREGMQWSAEIIRGRCPECLGTGVRDSGGVHPWGEPISVPCDCTDAILGGMETIV